MEQMGDAEEAELNGTVRVTWKAQSRSSLDSKALKEAHPDLAEQYTKTSSFRVLRIKESK
jgi:predicted phage-related endonuclease